MYKKEIKRAKKNLLVSSILLTILVIFLILFFVAYKTRPQNPQTFMEIFLDIIISGNVIGVGLEILIGLLILLFVFNLIFAIPCIKDSKKLINKRPYILLIIGIVSLGLLSFLGPIFLLKEYKRNNDNKPNEIKL